MYKTKVCTLNLSHEDNHCLRDELETMYEGSLGTPIQVPNKEVADGFKCFLNFDYPANNHEYDVFILDLQKKIPIAHEHEDIRTRNSEVTYFTSFYPQTIFDPIPYSLSLFFDDIPSSKDRKLFVIFSEADYEIEYMPGITSYVGDKALNVISHSLYDFLTDISSIDLGQCLSGYEMRINSNVSQELQQILGKHLEGADFRQTFIHPKLKDSEGNLYPNPSFNPLIFNKYDQIISFAFSLGGEGIFIFPQIRNKGEFLKEFLFQYIPNLYPNLFPNTAKNQWKNHEEYFLPNQKTLLRSKREEIERHKKALISIEEKIKKNNAQFGFLHDILTQTGDELVRSIVHFLKWLDFNEVVDYDEKQERSPEKKKIKAEDIQIETDQGLIVIEVKGIGGTSKDSECSQIAKVKYRRAKERKSFDVYAHYIVNHQRHLPPLQRESPPFSAEQIDDAINDERGLMSTWQLYQLYFQITQGIISKEEARARFYDFGLIQFRPKSILLGKIEEIFRDGKIAILELDNIELSVGDELLIEKNQMLEKRKILSIRVDNEDVEAANSGEVGIGMDKAIKKKSLVYKIESK